MDAKKCSWHIINSILYALTEYSPDKQPAQAPSIYQSILSLEVWSHVAFDHHHRVLHQSKEQPTPTTPTEVVVRRLVRGVELDGAAVHLRCLFHLPPLLQEVAHVVHASSPGGRVVFHPRLLLCAKCITYVWLACGNVCNYSVLLSVCSYFYCACLVVLVGVLFFSYYTCTRT